MKPLLHTCHLLAAAGAILAQEPGQQPPAPPLIAQAPPVSSWTITLLASPPAPETGQGRRETRVYKAGNRRLEITALPQGQTAETFVVNGVSFQKRPGFAPGDVYVEGAPQATDFPEFSWISAANFTGVKSDAGRKYYVYAWTPATIQMEATGSARQIASALAGSEGGKTMEAWIDVETRLPARLVHPTFQRLYRFSKSAPQDAEPSPETRLKAEAYFGGKIPDPSL